MEDLTVNNQGFEVFKGELPPQLPKPTIGFQNDQIQINRRAMRALGNPEYVNLMVNQDQKILIIKACKKDESGSAKLHPALLDITVIDSCEMFINQMKKRFSWPETGRFVFRAMLSDEFPFALVVHLDDPMLFSQPMDIVVPKES